jgi:hypothetical protein
MKPHAIDNSAAIFSAQKIREVNYKYRKRKVDQEREERGEPCMIQHNRVLDTEDDEEYEEYEEYEDPQPQEPSDFTSQQLESYNISTANIMNMIKEKSIDIRHQNSSTNQNLLKNNLFMSKQSDMINYLKEEAPRLEDVSNEALNNYPTRKVPSKK